MNGRTKYVLDTSAVLAIVKAEKIPAALADDLRHSKNFVSVITRIELFAYPSLKTDEAAKIRGFLKKCRVIPLNRKVESMTIDVRRDTDPKLKLPDAIIAATALILNATLLSNDTKLLNTTYRGLTTIGFPG
jgi:predicted nucleic acid-binding protein